MATMDEFKTILPQCYENYMGDDQITVDLRHAFEAFLAGVDLTGLSVPEAEDKLRYEIDQFSHSWQQRGREMAAAAETLGCLRELAGTARYVARAVGGISQADAEHTLREALACPDLSSQLSHLAALFGGLPLSEFQAFSYRPQPGVNPLVALDPDLTGSDAGLQHATCRLGLTKYGNQHLAFTLRLPHGERTFQPTFFDAGPTDLWHPKGRTRPLEKCKKEGRKRRCIEGMVEVVHGRLRLQWLTDYMRSTPK